MLSYEDGGFALFEAIESKADPTTFEYEITLGRGQEIVTTDDGGIAVVNKDGLTVAEIGAPWAFDVKGNSVPTSYSLDGDLLTLHVEHTLMAYEYPILADPCFRFWQGRCGGKMATAAGGGVLGARFYVMGAVVLTTATGGTTAPVTVTSIIATTAWGAAWGATWCAFTCNP